MPDGHPEWSEGSVPDGHPEWSEGSVLAGREILRSTQDDSGTSWMTVGRVMSVRYIYPPPKRWELNRREE